MPCAWLSHRCLGSGRSALRTRAAMRLDLACTRETSARVPAALSLGPRGAPAVEVGLSRASEEQESERREHRHVGKELGGRVEETHTDVGEHPHHEPPARPVAPAEERRPSNDRQHPQRPRRAQVCPAVGPELRELLGGVRRRQRPQVIEESCTADDNEEPADEDDGTRASYNARRRRTLRRSLVRRVPSSRRVAARIRSALGARSRQRTLHRPRSPKEELRDRGEGEQHRGKERQPNREDESVAKDRRSSRGGSVTDQSMQRNFGGPP